MDDLFSFYIFWHFLNSQLVNFSSVFFSYENCLGFMCKGYPKSLLTRFY